MGNVIRFYNQNRKNIWMFIIIVFFLFLILQLINFLVGKKQEENILEKNNSVNSISNSDNKAVVTNQSVTSGKTLSGEVVKTQTNLIKEFLNYCNKGDAEQAYNLLTESCKRELYPDKETFELTYFSKISKDEGISYTIENWSDSTYKVKITEDILSTGKVNTEGSFQDYITIKKQDDKNLININGYIGETEIKKKKEVNKINITVLKKDTYMDFEKYTIKIDNNSDSDILLDTKQDAKTMYISDKKNVHYSSYNHELTKADLLVSSKHSKEITIKYYSSHSSGKKIQKVVFSNVIMNYTSQMMVKDSIINEIEINI